LSKFYGHRQKTPTTSSLKLLKKNKKKTKKKQTKQNKTKQRKTNKKKQEKKQKTKQIISISFALSSFPFL
jgi:hypothetical protein